MAGFSAREGFFDAFTFVFVSTHSVRVSDWNSA
jgi:hypothetical protein